MCILFTNAPVNNGANFLSMTHSKHNVLNQPAQNEKICQSLGTKHGMMLFFADLKASHKLHLMTLRSCQKIYLSVNLLYSNQGSIFFFMTPTCKAATIKK